MENVTMDELAFLIELVEQADPERYLNWDLGDYRAGVDKSHFIESLWHKLSA